MVGDVDDVGESMDTDTEGEPETQSGVGQGTVTFEGFENNDDDDDDDEWEQRNVASVYEKTIGELDDVLGGPPIGIISNDWACSGTDQQRSGHGFIDTTSDLDL